MRQPSALGKWLRRGHSSKWQTSDVREEAQDPRMGRRRPRVLSGAGPEAGKEETGPWMGSSPVRPLPSSPRLAAHRSCEPQEVRGAWDAAGVCGWRGADRAERVYVHKPLSSCADGQAQGSGAEHKPPRP